MILRLVNCGLGFKLLGAFVASHVGVGFKNFDCMEQCGIKTLRGKLSLDADKNEMRYAFGAWVSAKKRIIIKIGMVKLTGYLFERALERAKIHKHSA